MANRKSDPTVLGIHLGKMVQQNLREKNLTQAELTRRLKRNHQTIIALLLKSHSMQAYLLWELSIALDHDFFSDISAALSEKHPQLKSATNNDKALIAKLQKELEEVTKDRDFLQKMIDVIAKSI